MKFFFTKNKKIPITAIVSIAILFSIAKFLQHRGGVTGDYRNDVYVRRVIDGDTIELSSGEKVRYIGIDAPEMCKREGVEWFYNPAPYAEEATNFNRKLVEGKSVRLEFDVQKRDKYNRLLAYVHSGDRMVNLEMIKEGYAMIYTYPPNVKYVKEFLNAQKEARESKNGLWRDLEKNVISGLEAKENVGFLRSVEAEVIDTFLSEQLLILNCSHNFKVVIFRNNLAYFPKIVLRSPDTYFKHKTIRVYGVIKEYKGSYEIVLHDPSQLEIPE